MGAAVAQTTAKSLFDDVKERVYQIRVIDIASGDKYSIGSGFAVSTEGHVATNFHVVSSFVHEPEKYRLETVRHNGSIGPISLLAIDVIHDLALVHTGETIAAHLPLGDKKLAKGARLYSLGNPHDLGMTVIEGTFNGLVENSRYQKILFSGSLNAGMSGGPAFNQEGEVIGVNVSKGGEQLSFLVPVSHLSALIDENSARPAGRDFGDEITAALLADQQVFYQSLTASTPKSKALGNLLVPDKLHESLKCWGHSVDEEDIKYQAAHQHCQSEDQIFISKSLYVGDFGYSFELINTDELNPFQFYNMLEERYQHTGFSNTYDKEEVSNFACHSDTVALESGAWKVSTCFRRYKKFLGLYDASMIMVSQDGNEQAAIVKMNASGVSLENANTMFRQLAEAVSWTP